MWVSEDHTVKAEASLADMEIFTYAVGGTAPIVVDDDGDIVGDSSFISATSENTVYKPPPKCSCSVESKSATVAKYFRSKITPEPAT